MLLVFFARGHFGHLFLLLCQMSLSEAKLHLA